MATFNYQYPNYQYSNQAEINELNQRLQTLANEKHSLMIENLKLQENLNQKQQELLKWTQRKLFTDIDFFIKDETFKDFKIIIDDREFHVHKFLLSARSPTLAAMLRNNPEAEKLKLVDISVEIFELILNFLYTDELLDQDEINYLHLFAVAGRLGIEELKNIVAQEILKNPREGKALELLNLANKYEHAELRQKAFYEIKKNYPKIEFKDEWAIDSEKISKIIEAYMVREAIVRKADEEFKRMLI